MAITDWPADERPREKLLARGAGALPDAELLAIHAGLECGLLTEKYPDLDIVSFGPNIRGAHSPDEKVQISSVQKIWKLFAATLNEVARS